MCKVRGQLVLKECHTGVDLPLWLLLFTMVFRVTFLIRQRGGTDYAVVDAYNLVNIVCTFAIAVVLTVKLQEVVFAVRKGGLAIWCIVCYYLICVGSGFWSVSPEFSTFRAFEFIFFFLAVMILVRKRDCFLKAEQLVLLSLNSLLLMQILSRIIVRIGANSTSLSMTGAILFAYSFGEVRFAARQRKFLLRVSLLMGFFGVFWGSSTGSNIALLVGGLVLILASPSHMRFLFLVAPALLLVKDWDRLLMIVTADKSLDDIKNLSHRANAWRVCLEIFLQRPLLGHGFGLATRHQLSSLLHAHNGYLEMLLGVGILGASVLIFGCIVILRDLGFAIKNRPNGSLGCFISIIVYLVNNFTQPGLGYIWTVPNVGFAFILAMFIYHVKPPRRRGSVT